MHSVNPFYVNNTSLDYAPDSMAPLGFNEAVVNTSIGRWRDTVYVPGNGSSQIIQKFAGEIVAWTGKTVFHCHFLDHEDQGMMAAIMIDDPALDGVAESDADSPATITTVPVAAPTEEVLSTPPASSSALSGCHVATVVFTFVVFIII